MADLNIAGARSNLSNVVENRDVPGWLNMGFACATGVFALITMAIWFDYIWIMLTKNPLMVFVALIGFGLTAAFPILCYSYGYRVAKSIEWNRQMDSIQLIGTLQGQMGMNTGQMTQGFLEAVALGQKLTENERAIMQVQIDQLTNELHDAQTAAIPAITGGGNFIDDVEEGEFSE